jgi:hypothetical protein
VEPDANATAPRRPRRRRPGGPGPDRAAWYALGAAIALAAALVLYETRGTTLFNDEVALFQNFGAGFDAETAFTPRNGHLLAVASLLYEAVFSAFGPDYLVLRIIDVVGLAVLALVLFEYLRRRVGAWLALAPTVVVLFLGASWETILWPWSIATFGFALAAGIGALLCVERRDRRGDLAACALLVLALACHSIALPFVVGVAVTLLWRSRHRGRAWVFLVPLVLYAIWWLWALRFDSSPALDSVNVWLIPAYAAEALAVVLAALTGLGATVSGEGLNPTIQIEPGWGRLLAIAAVIGLAIRVSRRRVPIALVATLAILATFWALAALSLGPDRAPDESRYILPGAVLVLLVAANALAGIRLPSAARIAVAVLAVFAVATGIRQLHDGALFLRDYSVRAQATAAGVEAAAASIPRGYEPRNDPALAEIVPPQLPLIADDYLAAADEYGSIAYSQRELDDDAFAADVAEQVRVAVISAGAGVEPPKP